MTQRVAKIESLIQQVVAKTLVEFLERDAATVTVTRVDAAPDMRNATVWIGLLAAGPKQDKLWTRVQATQNGLQIALAHHLESKFVPHLTLKLDTGGAYAAEIDRLLKGL